MTVHSHITESPSGEWEKDWIPNAMMSQSLEPNCLPSFLPSFLPVTMMYLHRNASSDRWRFEKDPGDQSCTVKRPKG
jgi:hypothetical protein